MSGIITVNNDDEEGAKVGKREGLWNNFQGKLDNKWITEIRYVF